MEKASVSLGGGVCVRLYCMMLFCRTLLLTGGGGFMILSLVTLSEGLTSISQRLWSAFYLMSCG